MKVPVLIPKAFNFPLTYDSGSNKSLKTGDIVVVPFEKKKRIRSNLGQNSNYQKEI